MPSDLVKRIDLDKLFPPFLERVLGVLAACRARGQDYYATFGYRSFGEQHQLRMRYLAGTGGKAAPAGLSAHQYGLAVDLAPDGDPKPGLQPVWTAARYRILGEETAKAGLVWGASFGDMPHVQWPGYVNGTQLKVLKDVYAKRQSLADVWAFLAA